MMLSANEISSLKVGDSVEVMLRDMSGACNWFPAVVSGHYHQSLEDYYEGGKVALPDAVMVTVHVGGREFPNYVAKEGKCRKA